MRIGIDARPLISANLAGIGVYVDEIIKYLSKNDSKNEYVLYTHKPFEVERKFNNNFKIKVLSGKIGTLWVRYVLPGYLKADKIEVFWGTEHVLPKRVKGVRYVLTIHDVALLINPQWGKWYNSIIQNVFVKKSCKAADVIIADSESTKNDIVNICKIKREKIKRIYIGGVNDFSELLSEERFIKAKRKYNIRDKYFLYIGTIEPRKNVKTIIKSFELIANQYKDVELVLAGGLGWKYKRILKQINESSVKERIKLTGYVSKEEKVNLYQGARAFLFPSYYEGFGIPILEAMSIGTIVITANNSSLPEVAGKAAIYVDSSCYVKSLKNAMERILNMGEEERSKWIEAGKHQNMKFSWENCGQETQELIYEVGGQEWKNC